MKNFLLGLAALFAVAAPAAAATNTAFTGPRVEITAGTDNISDSISYGAGIGVDFPLGDRFTVGVEGTANDVFDRTRVLGVVARLGFAVTPQVLLFGAAGYEDYRLRGLDGLRYGGGAELALGRFGYGKLEYRRGSEGQDTGLVGVGLRF